MHARVFQVALLANLVGITASAAAEDHTSASLLETVSARQEVPTGMLPDGLVPYPQVLSAFKKAYDIPIAVEHLVDRIPGSMPDKDLRTITDIVGEALSTRLPPASQRLNLLRDFETTRHIAFRIHGGTALSRKLAALNEVMDNAFAWTEAGGMVFIHPRDYGPGSPSAAFDTRIDVDITESTPWEAFVALEDAYHATGPTLPLFFDMPCMGAYVMIRGWLDRPQDEFLREHSITLQLKNAPLREAIGTLCHLVGQGRPYHLSLDARATDAHPAPTMRNRSEAGKPFGRYIGVGLILMEGGRQACVRKNPAGSLDFHEFFETWDPFREARAARLAKQISRLDRAR